MAVQWIGTFSGSYVSIVRYEMYDGEKHAKDLASAETIRSDSIDSMRSSFQRYHLSSYIV